MVARQECGEVAAAHVSDTASRNNNSADGDGDSRRNHVDSSSSSGGSFVFTAKRKAAVALADDIVGNDEVTHSGLIDDAGGADRPPKRIKLTTDSSAAGSLHLPTNVSAVGSNPKERGGVPGSHGSGSLKSVSDHNATDIVIQNELGNELLKISFTDEMWSRLLEPPGHAPPKEDGRHAGQGTYSQAERSSYGVKYNFALKDNAKDAAVDAPEWLVPQVQPLPYFILIIPLEI